MSFLKKNKNALSKCFMLYILFACKEKVLHVNMCLNVYCSMIKTLSPHICLGKVRLGHLEVKAAPKSKNMDPQG